MELTQSRDTSGWITFSTSMPLVEYKSFTKTSLVGEAVHESLMRNYWVAFIACLVDSSLVPRPLTATW